LQQRAVLVHWQDGGWVGTSGSEPYGAAASDASSPRSRQSMFQPLDCDLETLGMNDLGLLDLKKVGKLGHSEMMPQ